MNQNAFDQLLAAKKSTALEFEGVRVTLRELSTSTILKINVEMQGDPTDLTRREAMLLKAACDDLAEKSVDDLMKLPRAFLTKAAEEIIELCGLGDQKKTESESAPAGT